MRMLRCCLRLLACGALLASPIAEVAASCPSLLGDDTEAVVAAMVGPAVLYPMDTENFRNSVSCLINEFAREDYVLASSAWDVTQGLWRIMAADPAQFFAVLNTVPAGTRAKWTQSFAFAAWWPTEACPVPDAIQLARSAIEATRLEGGPEVQRVAVLKSLEHLECRVTK